MQNELVQNSYKPTRPIQTHNLGDSTHVHFRTPPLKLLVPLSCPPPSPFCYPGTVEFPLLAYPPSFLSSPPFLPFPYSLGCAGRCSGCGREFRSCATCCRHVRTRTLAYSPCIFLRACARACGNECTCVFTHADQGGVHLGALVAPARERRRGRARRLGPREACPRPSREWTLAASVIQDKYGTPLNLSLTQNILPFTQLVIDLAVSAHSRPEDTREWSLRTVRS
jgi:hypothetical protein